MTKNELLNMHYRQLEVGETDTLVKQFETGVINIFQFDSDKVIGAVRLTKEEFEDIKNHLLY